MRRLAIEISDAGLLVADDERVVWSEPAYAVVDRDRIMTGEEAYSLARLRPRDTSSTHWGQLSIDPGSARVRGSFSTAELAHAQLDTLWRAVGSGVDQVVIVVPSSFESESLGVLLGLAQECGIPVGALVDAACAASLKPWPGRQLVYVDAGLTGVFVTPLNQGDEAAAEPPIKLDSVGLGGVMDGFARRIGELFVFGTRFDPFHRAKTEQRLYDALPDALAALDRDGKATVVISDRDERFEVELERSTLLGSAQGFYRAVRQLIAQSRQAQAGLVINLSDRLGSLPGIKEELSRLDAATIVDLEPGHAARAVLAAAESLALDDEAVKLFRHLPWREDPELTESMPSENEPVAAPHVAVDPSRPTHVVYQGVAYPVNGEGIVIGRSKLDQRRAILIEARAEGVSRAHCELRTVDGELTLRDLSSFGTFVNERRIEGVEVLKPADIIRVGTPGAELTVVRVEDGDGA